MPAAGVKVVIATGRPIAGVAKLLDDLGKLRDEGDYVRPTVPLYQEKLLMAMRLSANP